MMALISSPRKSANAALRTRLTGYSTADSSLLALYSFGDLKTSKYLCQFVPASVSFINQIPAQLLGKDSQ